MFRQQKQLEMRKSNEMLITKKSTTFEGNAQVLQQRKQKKSNVKRANCCFCSLDF